MESTASIASSEASVRLPHSPQDWQGRRDDEKDAISSLLRMAAAGGASSPPSADTSPLGSPQHHQHSRDPRKPTPPSQTPPQPQPQPRERHQGAAAIATGCPSAGHQGESGCRQHWHPHVDSLQTPPHRPPQQPRRDDRHHERQQHQHQISVLLSRPSASVRWGITVSLLDERMSMLVVVSRESDALGGSPLASPPPSRLLRAGDCIAAVNGRPVPWFGSLHGLTSFMRHALVLDLLVVRSAAAATATLPPGFPHGTPGVVGPHHSPSSYHYINSSSPLSATPTWVTTRPTISSKVVTPPPPRRLGAKKRLREEAPEEDPDDDSDGGRAGLFLSRIDDFGAWLTARKETWRSKFWKASGPPSVGGAASADDPRRAAADGQGDGDSRRDDSSVPADFWSRQGHASFQDWLQSSKAEWSKRYSWNRKKRMRWEAEILSADSGTVASSFGGQRMTPFSSVHVGYCCGGGGDGVARVAIDDDFDAWLRARKRQWLISRRKRQRQRQQVAPRGERSPESSGPSSPRSSVAGATVPETPTLASSNRELLIIDELLDEEERHRVAREARPPLDLSVLFDAERCPDDAVVHVLAYLDLRECGKLLHVCRGWRSALVRRERVWQDLCPKRWTLPRRPRKPWHEIFLRNLRSESEASQKKWDDLLGSVSQVLERGDCLQQVEKLVGDAERAFGFNVNYTSGVVCERNAILNLAVIHQRCKVVRWLVEAKGADIETCDRGHFTPLMNAAWGGDKYLVRFLLQKGADRSKVGFYHYSKGLSSTGFKGLTAGGWAEEKGFPDIATLIRMGL